MISKEVLQAVATRYHTSVAPNVVREYFQHEFLSEFYRLPGAEHLFFKGGTALRIVYGSPRFSEDLDFSVFGVPTAAAAGLVEDLFLRALAVMQRSGIHVDLDAKSDATLGGYFGRAEFSAPSMSDFQPVGMEINVSTRNGRAILGEVDSIANDFVPTYTLIHLSQSDLVEEKIFGALIKRKKPRDFYDLYFIMRRGMLTSEQKTRLATLRDAIIFDARSINFRTELSVFLPVDQQPIIADFVRALAAEMNRQLSLT
ncbi:nucleotidyl transferase AbiEii/AbiGii toxin family protein [Candidatus Kaiserbacteria bacterium]|nr:nucleotidyl transferase AbiEii/AbiGii toxin family protein [Candidatus Kaiserbacteria bacterium]